MICLFVWFKHSVIKLFFSNSISAVIVETLFEIWLWKISQENFINLNRLPEHIYSYFFFESVINNLAIHERQLHWITVEMKESRYVDIKIYKKQGKYIEKQKWKIFWIHKGV